MTVGEMIRLRPETVKMWSGEKWVQVIEFNPTTETDGIEIELRNGQRISCTPGHLWPTTHGEKRADDLEKGDELLIVNLPEPKQFSCPQGIPDEFGWVMGYYLAEGSNLKRDGVQFAMNVQENDAVDKLRRFSEYYGSSCTVFDYHNSRQVHILGGVASAVIHEYISGEGCKHKHLSTAAWQRSNNFLQQLLMGYLAGDGGYDAKNIRWRLGFTRNDALAEDLRTICARLGVSIRLKRAWAKNSSGQFYGWHGEIRLTQERRRTSDTEIVGIQKSKSARFYDISIEEPHVFALSSGVLTHNSKKNPMPESVRDRPTKSHEDVFLLSKQPIYYYDADAIREPNTTQVKSKRQKDGVKNIQGNMSERGVTRTTEGLNLKSAEEKQNPQGRNKRDVWVIATHGYKGAHFAVMPEGLVEPCVLAGTSAKGCCPVCGKPWKRIINKVRPELRKIKGVGPHGDHGLLGGNRFDEPIQVNTVGWQAICKCNEEPIPCRVLDPFSGAGTVGVVCARYGRSFIGVDLNPEYIALARQRVDKIQMRFIP